MGNEGNIRVRFAPSPTGYLHVGGLRTALFNYLFSKNQGGKVILRIEDTDRKRYVEGAMENLISTLEWSGLDFDEGPHKGGERGPYIQSERFSIYKEYVQKLIDNGYAYYCFCSAERLEKLRQRQQAMKQPPRYDRHCLKLSKEEIEEKLKNGEPYVIRLKIPSGKIVFQDLIRGKIEIDGENIDDQVLLKSDGFPTYHLANVVDDHLMGITHVIRGEEWLPSTPKHLILYKGFGWEPPQFAHLPLILNKDRTKLSKRQGDVAVEDYRDKGYLKEALINYLALLGWNPGDDREFFTLSELTKEFSLHNVSKSGAVFDLEKLKWMNKEYIKNLYKERTEYIEKEADVFLKKMYGNKNIETEKFRKMYQLVYENSHTLIELVENAYSYYNFQLEFPEKGLKILEKQEVKDFLVFSKTFILENKDISKEELFKTLIERGKKEFGLKGKFLYMPLRLAITSREHGPEMKLVFSVYTHKEMAERIEKTLSWLETNLSEKVEEKE
jgi:glutamyl-tRNA synthetase